jgi:predicted TIM-barrel fold metal-dependent hydrolase
LTQPDALQPPVVFDTPKVDCHVHIFDPVRFPYREDAFYRPAGGEIATVSQLDELFAAHDVQHALLVGPNSGYGLDNRCLLDALAQGAGRYKGIAVVRNDASRGELQDLQGAGVIGVAFNVALLGVDFYRDTGPLLHRLRDLGMWAQVQVEGNQLVSLLAMLVESGAKLLFDHCGRPFPQAGIKQPGFSALLGLASSGRAFVKLSSLTKSSNLPYPHPDAWPFVHALLEAFTPRSLVWASDWPFLRAPARIDYGPLLTLMERLVPDRVSLREILWETPNRIFGFLDKPVSL